MMDDLQRPILQLSVLHRQLVVDAKIIAIGPD
jgi:hypothetical protein